MGQGTDRLSSEREPRRLEREIETLRADLDDLVGELDRRRRQAGWVLTLVSAYARPLSVAAALLGGALALRRLARRRPEPWHARLLARLAR
jgi:hypothetical protein